MDRHVTIVGAGIVGVCCAAQLQRAGFTVTLIDRLGPGEGCSFGNAGGLAIGEIVPLSVPGVLRRLPAWLADPLGPLALRWSHLPSALPFLWGFWRASRPRRLAEIVAALAVLAARTHEDYAPLLEAAGITDLIGREDCVIVYEDERELADDALSWRLRRDNGIAFERLSGRQLADLEPDLAPDLFAAMRVPGWHFVRDPHRMVVALAEKVVRHGGRLVRDEVRAIETEGGRIRSLRLVHAGRLGIDRVLITAGAWSDRLLRPLGHGVPLESERGYHVMLPEPGVTLHRKVVYKRGGFVATPMAGGLRLAGTVEIAGLDAPPDYRRARILAERARRLLPGLAGATASEWMGHRPTLPDSLPVIDRSDRFINLYVAFGHGHLGLTLAATTGRLVAELIDGGRTTIDPSPYRLDRFGRGVM